MARETVVRGTTDLSRMVETTVSMVSAACAVQSGPDGARDGVAGATGALGRTVCAMTGTLPSAADAPTPRRARRRRCRRTGRPDRRRVSLHRVDPVRRRRAVRTGGRRGRGLGGGTSGTGAGGRVGRAGGCRLGLRGVGRLGLRDPADRFCGLGRCGHRRGGRGTPGRMVASRQRLTVTSTWQVVAETTAAIDVPSGRANPYTTAGTPCHSRVAEKVAGDADASAAEAAAAKHAPERAGVVVGLAPSGALSDCPEG